MPPLPAFASALSLGLHCIRAIPPQTLPPNRLHTRQPTRSVIQTDSNFHATVKEKSASRYASASDVSFQQRARQLTASGELPRHVTDTLLAWFDSYRQAAEDNETFIGDATELTEEMFTTLLELARLSVEEPIRFEPFHEKMRVPFDYYKFGFDFASVLINVKESTVRGKANLEQAVEYAKQGHNVIFFSNHQSEGDPYAIDYMLDWVAGCEREFCEDLIFMAGDRVRNDPVVCPFSAGRNLLTVYSKKHINDVPELRQGKLQHNRRTIHATAALFKKGGSVVWFAPSGGRDRRSKETKCVEVSAFDEGAVEMMRFTAEKSGVPSHFFPMSIRTYDMLPPPSNVGGAEIGEDRVVNYIPMHMHVGEELDFTLSPEVTDRMERRKARCDIAQNAVIAGYRAIGGYDG